MSCRELAMVYNCHGCVQQGHDVSARIEVINVMNCTLIDDAKDDNPGAWIVTHIAMPEENLDIVGVIDGI